MTEKSIDAGKNAGTERDGSNTKDNLDAFRLALTPDDFKNIDTDHNNKLSAMELRSSSESGNLPAEKQTAVDGLLSFLDKQPVHTLGKDHEIHTVVDNWNNADFASSNMTKLDFSTLDKDGNKVLSKSELQSAKDDKNVSDSGRAAAGIFLNLVDGRVSDERGIVRDGRVNDFTKLDPLLKDKSDAELLTLSSKVGNPAEKVRLLDEVIARKDFKFDENDVATSAKSIAFLQKALSENRDIIQGADGKPELGNSPLTADRRFDFHRAIFGDLDTIGEQINLKQQKSWFLESTGKQKEAIAATEDAMKSADVFTKSYSDDGSKTTLADLVKTERDLLIRDGGNDKEPKKRSIFEIQDPAKREQFKIAAKSLDQNLLTQPAATRAGLSRQLLGFRVDQFQLGKGIVFDTKSPTFNPTRVDELQAEAKKYIKENLGFDPTIDTQRPNLTSVFGEAWSVVDPKNQYNFYQDRNNNGKSDLVERLRGLKSK